MRGAECRSGNYVDISTGLGSTRDGGRVVEITEFERLYAGLRFLSHFLDQSQKPISVIMSQNA